MEILEISQGLIWAIIYKNPSNSFYVITTETQKKQKCEGQSVKVWLLLKSYFFQTSIEISSSINPKLNVNIWENWKFLNV